MAQQQTPRQVAERATESVDMPRTGPMLLGVFGNETAPEALVRLPNGRLDTVALGDRVNGRQVVAIDTGRIALARGGKAYWLEQLGGR
ncbi:amidophosphoribosyltransferase [Salipiger bermudensis]|nr:amidophosphoribosyltransferase [Salipiger bermudensis]MBR9893561.1 amidophosphoribosyltransferase [bacterium]